jgi:hypothetical protein
MYAFIHRSLTVTGILVCMFTAVSITASPGTDWIVSTQNADASYVTSTDIKYGLLTTPHFMSRPPFGQFNGKSLNCLGYPGGGELMLNCF